MQTTEAPDKKRLRSFGLIVGGIFLLIGLWPLVVHGSPMRAWAVVLAVLLIPPALIFPRVLHWPYRGWMFVGHILGAINTRIILGIIFFIVFTPIGLIMRAFRYDPMTRRFDSALKTYRVMVKPRDSNHMDRQF